MDIRSQPWTSMLLGCQIFLCIQPRGHYQTAEAASRNDWDNCPHSPPERQCFTLLWTGAGCSGAARWWKSLSDLETHGAGAWSLQELVSWLLGLQSEHGAVSLKSIPQPMTWQTEISVQISPQVWAPEATESEISSWICRLPRARFTWLGNVDVKWEGTGWWGWHSSLRFISWFFLLVRGTNAPRLWNQQCLEFTNH